MPSQVAHELSVSRCCRVPGQHMFVVRCLTVTRSSSLSSFVDFGNATLADINSNQIKYGFLERIYNVYNALE